MPKTTGSRARLLLNKIKNNKDIMHWNSRGELIYYGKVIPSTQIVDLVRDVMKARKNFDPNGWQIFARGLAKINTPYDWVGHEDRKNVMVQYKNRSEEGVEEPIRLLPSPPRTESFSPRKTPKRSRKVLSPTLSKGKWLPY